jgi:hypothetical protein
LAGALVFWCTQPATVGATPPPSPLASIFTDLTGDTPLTQPVITDGFGHADAYMDDSVLYTVSIYHPLFGPYPIVLRDQWLGGGGGGGSSLTPFAGPLLGTVNGTNKVFTLTNNGTALGVAPVQQIVWFNFPLIQGLGYTLSGDMVTFANAPQPASGGTPADALYATGFYNS